MNEILSVLRLKDRIIIAAVMSAFALLLGGTAGGVSVLTEEHHDHKYEYHLEKAENGGFDFVGECTVEDCEDPVYARPVISGITEYVKTQPNCTDAGVKEYCFTYADDMVTYTYTEAIPALGHSFKNAAFTEGDVTEATFVSEGEVKLTCSAKGCDHVEPFVLPKAVEGVNTTLQGADKLNGLKTWKYSYTFDEFGIIVEHEFTTELSVTQKVDFNKDGEVKLTCYTKDGEHVGSFVLPKAVEGVNTILQNIDEVNEKKTWKYSYTFDEFGIIVEDEFDTVFEHTHTYEYELIPFNGQFALKGICSRHDCDELSIIEVEPTGHEAVNSTCNAPGYESWSYTQDGQTYVFTLDLPADPTKHTFVCDISKTVYPTVDKGGHAVLECTNEGCTSVTDEITLDKVVIGENAVLNEETGNVTYTIKFELNGIEMECTEEFSPTGEHEHAYPPESYELVPTINSLNGEFDLIAECIYAECEEKIVIETGIIATLVEDKSSCSTGIDMTWNYEYMGNVYTFRLFSPFAREHKIVTDLAADTSKLPTLTESGSIIISCSECHKINGAVVELPAIVVGENAVVSQETDLQISYDYTHNCVIDGESITVKLIIVIIK